MLRNYLRPCDFVGGEAGMCSTVSLSFLQTITKNTSVSRNTPLKVEEQILENIKPKIFKNWFTLPISPLRDINVQKVKSNTSGDKPNQAQGGIYIM